MRSLKTFAVAATVVMAAPLALAADFPGPPPAHLPPPPVVHAPVAEGFSGFYLRGDIGVGENDAKFEVIDRRPGVSPQVAPGHNPDIGSFVSGGLGVGYQINNWFRVDATGEYRTKSGFSFTDKYCNIAGGAGQLCSPAQIAAGATSQGENFFRGNLGSMVFLANAYVDLGTWNGLTPFIGAGIGVANHRISGVTDAGLVNQFSPFPFTGPAGGNLANSNKTNFAWAVMAGLGYDVTPNYKVEIGYRYLNMGSIASGYSDCGTPACGFNIRAKDLDSHEIRFGMRWLLGAPVAQVAEHVPTRIVKRY
jgi:opacity protein-like surface antigen